MSGLADLDGLAAATLTGSRVRLEPLAEHHREALRTACAADPQVWTDWYSYSMLGAHFDAWWTARMTPGQPWITFAVLDGDRVVGTSSYLNIAPSDARLEIGGTYIDPSVRGGPFNREMKRLMLAAAFARNARRVELRIDAINLRSRRATEKLGARLDGILRAERVTWTGRIRDTCVYSILADEWREIDARLAQG